MADFLAGYGEILIIGFCLILLGLTSAAETSLISVDKMRLNALAAAGDHRAKLVKRLLEDRPSLLTSLVITTNACLLIVSAFFTSFSLRFAGEQWLPLTSAGMIIVILIFFEVTPKALGLRHGQRTALFFARPAAALVALLSPLIWVLSRLGRAIIRATIVPLFGGSVMPTTPPYTDEDIKQLLAAGQREGELEAEEREMLHAAIEFSDKVAREIMVPRPDLVSLPETATVSAAVQVGLETGFSRLPVYHGDLDHIVGILYMRDILPRVLEGALEAPISTLMRPPYFVPESKPIDELLRDMQGRRAHLAVIIDEYGAVGGLVTIEDVLEEIVGEIRDEYDVAEEEPLVMLNENTAIALARVSPDEIAEKFSVKLPEGEFDTLGGFLMAELGRLPEVGDKIEYGPLLFEIETLEEQRIERVRITRQLQEETTYEDDQETE